MYLVLINHEEQYSLWPSYKAIPFAVGEERTKEEFLTYIDEVWTDMRPLSLRKRILIMTSMIFLVISSAKAMMDDNEGKKHQSPLKTKLFNKVLVKKIS